MGTSFWATVATTTGTAPAPSPPPRPFLPPPFFEGAPPGAFAAEGWLPLEQLWVKTETAARHAKHAQAVRAGRG